MSKPIPTGIVVMQNIVIPKDKIFILGALDPRKYSIEKLTIIGRVITEIILTIAVKEIDKAVSPFANFVSILDVTPPGQHARIIIPTAISLGNFIISKIKKAIKGRSSIWFTRPKIRALGCVMIFLKFSNVSPIPKVNIMNIRDTGIKISIIINFPLHQP